MTILVLIISCIFAVQAYSGNDVMTEIRNLRNIIELQNGKINMIEKKYEELKTEHLAQDKEFGALKQAIADITEVCKVNDNKQNTSRQGAYYLSGGKEFKRKIGARNGLKRDIRINGETDVSSIAFYAYMTHKVSNVGGHHQLVFDVIQTNVGGGYHPSGVFIVPETGLYVFTWSFRVYHGGVHAVELAVNGRRMGVAFSKAPLDDSEQTSATIVISVSKGDDVFLRTGDGNNNGEIFSGPYGYTYFIGWKIY